MKKRALSFSILALSTASFADVPLTQTVVELSAETSQLSNNNPDWHSESLRVARKLGQRDVKELTLTQTRRFDLADQQISGFYVTPLSEKLTASVGANISPSHRVLAKHGIDATLQYEFAPAWLAHAGLGSKR